MNKYLIGILSLIIITSFVYGLVDTLAPDVLIGSPLNQTYPPGEIIFSINATDDNGIDSCWYNLDSGNNISLVTQSWNLSTAIHDDVDISTQDITLRDFFFGSDGTRLYEVGDGLDTFFQYTCTDSWNLSTCSYDSVSISTQDSTPTGISFKSDGAKMYEIGDTNNLIYQSTCSDEWNLSSCIYDSISISTEDGQPIGIFFKTDGTVLYQIGNNRDLFYQSTCSDAWNLSSCTYDNVNISTQDTTPTGMYFKPDGTRLYEVGANYNLFYEYLCSDPWNLSSCIYNNVNISTEHQLSTGIFFKPDGTKIYAIDDFDDEFHQLSLSEEWSFTNSSVSVGSYVTDYYCNDTFSNLNNTETITFSVVSDTCTYSGGDWNIDCNDNCSITSDVNLNGNDLVFSNPGNLFMKANITNYANLNLSLGCSIILYDNTHLISS